MPAVPTGPALTTTWFCPGVPATGADGTAGDFVVSNSTAGPLTARVTLLAGAGQAVTQARRDPGARALDDQRRGVRRARRSSARSSRSTAPAPSSSSGPTEAAGTSVAPCTTTPSTNWYLAEGFTADESTEQLVLTNPFDQTVIVDVGFATDEGSREPSQLQGFPIAPRSVQVIDVDSIAARDEPQVAVRVSRPARGLARRRAGPALRRRRPPRLQHDAGVARCCARSGGSPTALKGPGITERYSIYNPGDDDVQVQPLFLGIPTDTPVAVDPIDVPAGELVTYTSDTVAGLPDGRHGMLFDTQDAGQTLVVERAITRTIEDVPTTSVLLGGLPRGEDALDPDRRGRSASVPASRRRTRCSSTTPRTPRRR